METNVWNIDFGEKIEKSLFPKRRVHAVVGTFLCYKKMRNKYFFKLVRVRIEKQVYEVQKSGKSAIF